MIRTHHQRIARLKLYICSKGDSLVLDEYHLECNEEELIAKKYIINNLYLLFTFAQINYGSFLFFAFGKTKDSCVEKQTLSYVAP